LIRVAFMNLLQNAEHSTNVNVRDGDMADDRENEGLEASNELLVNFRTAVFGAMLDQKLPRGFLECNAAVRRGGLGSLGFDWIMTGEQEFACGVRLVSGFL
jgi:hypothetical protein